MHKIGSHPRNRKDAREKLAKLTFQSMCDRSNKTPRRENNATINQPVVCKCMQMWCAWHSMANAGSKSSKSRHIDISRRWRTPATHRSFQLIVMEFIGDWLLHLMIPINQQIHNNHKFSTHNFRHKKFFKTY